MNSTSLERTESPVSGFCYAQSQVCNACKSFRCDLNKTLEFNCLVKIVDCYKHVLLVEKQCDMKAVA